MSVEKLKTAIDQINGRVAATRGLGEEATKQALILPMLDALGYNIWNPAEVCPEFEADFAVKKAGQREKVDLAILFEGQPRIYFEVKPVNMALDGHEGQLARYFNATTSVALAILTNGVEYQFFTDTGEPNLMDKAPFYSTRIDSPDLGIDVLARFHKAVFSPTAIRDYATELIYLERIIRVLRAELDLRDREPSENFVRWVLSGNNVYTGGRVTGGVVERFGPIVKNALTVVLRDVVRRSIAALDKGVSEPEAAEISDPEPDQQTEVSQEREEDRNLTGSVRSRTDTTEAELDCFAEIKTIFDGSPLAERTIFDRSAQRHVPVELAYKDTTGYFGVYLNKPGYWVLRLIPEAREPWVGFNCPRERVLAMLPPDFHLLAPSPWAPVRVGFSGAESLRKLGAVILACFEHVIDQRSAKSDAVD